MREGQKSSSFTMPASALIVFLLSFFSLFACEHFLLLGWVFIQHLDFHPPQRSIYPPPHQRSARVCWRASLHSITGWFVLWLFLLVGGGYWNFWIDISLSQTRHCEAIQGEAWWGEARAGAIALLSSPSAPRDWISSRRDANSPGWAAFKPETSWLSGSVKRCWRRLAHK